MPELDRSIVDFTEATEAVQILELSDPADVSLYRRLSEYDGTAPEAEHLRNRQLGAVTAFCENASTMLAGEIPLQRMSVIHPTGSGKTVLASEIMRVVADADDGQNVIMLVPGLEILGQAVGTKDDIGDIRSHMPEISVGQYSGERKSIDNRITVMSYQMLRRALKSGHINQINPKLYICDEVHHIIDGSWADDVKEATEGVLALGLSATPAYSSSRDARELFPRVLDHMTMKEGIETGILSDFEGHIYQGEARITLGRGEEVKDEDVFNALIESKDNYLAAAICAAEIARGRRGIVSCVPGHDRVHAKVMAKILSQTMVDTAEGQRPINAAYIDGDMDPDEREEILRRYHQTQPEIDAITFVGLLLEGWNSPQTDFGVWVRPTPSKVLAEQRMGRLLRRRSGKTATLHEIVYDVDKGSDFHQMTHVDVLEDTNPSKVYTAGGNNNPNRNRYSGRARVDASKIVIGADIEQEIAARDTSSEQDTVVVAQQEEVPYDWPTLHILATKLGVPRAEAKQVLEANSVPAFNEISGGRSRTFYEPEAYSILAKHAGISAEVQEGYVTMAEIIDHCRYSELSRVVIPQDVNKHLREQGFTSSRCLQEQSVIDTYPDTVLESLAEIPGTRAPKQKRQEVRRRDPGVDAASWLTSVLVDPRAENGIRQRQVLLAQNCLVNALRTKPVAAVHAVEKLDSDIKRLDLQPTPRMQEIMKAKKVDFTRLLIAASHARDEWVRLVA